MLESGFREVIEEPRCLLQTEGPSTEETRFCLAEVLEKELEGDLEQTEGSEYF